MTQTHAPEPAPKRFGWPTMIVLGALGGILAVGGVMYVRNASSTNHVALADSPKRVSTIAAASATYRARRRYVGTVEPWLEAKIGPQLVSAYVNTVLVRPGAAVKRGDVVATLDCRNTSAQNRQVDAQARAVDAMSTAAASEATRLQTLLKGQYVSENEVEQKRADAASKGAQVAALRAQLASTSLEVDDCVLRAPFDGEVADRFMDPGAFARPGGAIASVVDRHLVRISVDAPEEDFDAVAVATPVSLHLLSIGKDLTAQISRRAPAADRGTRTAHVEIDVEDAARAIPVWTTAEVSLDTGPATPAATIPIAAASVHGAKATLFIIGPDDAHAHTKVVKIIGEHDGMLYIDPAQLPVGTKVVTEGRTALTEGDAVALAVKS